ncbi:helix-turn-helix domain-containing protein [Salinarimonas sp.]|uniref:helix-turn-helix domain-containing protein n=1 Tax=Salinarimonas sp. TaxID=2766526 RepID=UPI00391CF899
MSLAVVFGANLRNLRKARGLTQGQLAERAALTAEMISKIERGVAAPSFPTIERLADALDQPEVAFFGIDQSGARGGSRGRLVVKIHATLSRMNEDELARASKILAVLAS